VTRRSPRRNGERGFTLVEVLVSLALLVVISTIIAVVFSVGMHALLAPGASEDRLTASSEGIALEQVLTEDVHRATCVKYAQAPSSYGNCAGDFFNGQCPGSANVLCIGWPDSGGGCGMAVYSLSTTPATRSSGVVGGAPLVTTDYPAVTVRSSPPADTWRTTGLQVSLTVTDPDLPGLMLDLQPLASDPWGSAVTC